MHGLQEEEEAEEDIRMCIACGRRSAFHGDGPSPLLKNHRAVHHTPGLQESKHLCAESQVLPACLRPAEKLRLVLGPECAGLFVHDSPCQEVHSFGVPRVRSLARGVQ